MVASHRQSVAAQARRGRIRPRGVVIFGLDDTIERRRGHQIQAKGIDRDPVRSSHAQVVNVSGLRWLAWMVLTPLSWANRVWALPFLTVLCPSERFYEPRGRRHQTLTERAWQMMRLVVRWWPGRELACVADSCFAALELLDKVKTWPRARVITRLRLDAALDDPSPPREPGTKGRPRPKARTALLRKLKPIFRRHRSGPLRGFIEEINPILRGWVQYFAFGHSSQCFSYVRRWVEQQVRRHLATARKRPGFGWKRWSRRWLYDSMGLFAAYRVTYRPSTSAAPVG